MKFAILGAVIAATVLGALPASAQVEIRTERSGVVVQERYNGYEQGRHRGWEQRRHRGWEHARWRRNHAECRVVRSRIVTPSGRVIIKTRRSC